MRRILLVALMLSVVFAVPSTINYQGKLTDASGVALNGYYNMQFRIYDAESGGTLLWSESHSSVSVTKGLFNVLLGETDPIDLPFDGQYYLEIQVGADVLTPRIPLSTVPYAFRANVADSVSGGTGQVLTLSFGSDDTLRLTQSVGSSFAVNIPVREDDLSDNSVNDLGDVNTSGVSAGQVLKWDGSAWVPADDDTGTGGGGSSQWTAAATYIYPDSAGEAVKIYNNGRVYADVSGGVSGGQAAVRGDVSGTVWGALGYYNGTDYRAGEFSGDVEIINSGDLYVSGQIFDGDASDPDVNIGEDLTVSGDIDGNGNITIDGSATFCAGGFGYVNVNNARIVNVADPTAAQDAATKNYVDSNFLQTVNTSAPVVGDGTSGSPVTVASGGITTSYLADNAVTTAKIADEAVTAAKISASGGSEGQVLKVVSGVVQWADDEGGTAGVNSVTAGDGLSNSGTSSDPVLDVNAGDGLGISSDQLVVNVDGTTIEITSDQLRVAAGGIGTINLADGAVSGVKIAQMGASTGQVLKWNGSAWAPAADNVNDADASATNEVITAFSYSDLTDTLAITEAGNTWKVEIDNEADDLSDNNLSDLGDVSSTAPSTGQVLRWNGSAWAPAADNTGTDDQTLSWSGSGPYLIDIEGTSNDAGVEAGVGISLSLTGDTLVITNTGDLSNTNELQTLSLSGANLTISSGNTVSFSGWDTNASNDLTTSTSFSGDVSGTYNSLNINSGVVGNTEIADATQFVDVYTNGSYRFSVSDGSQTLDFNEGTGIDISYNATGHDVTITHQDMSSQSSVNNSDGTVIQDVTLDYTGHVTGLASVNLDNRYAQGSGTSNYLVKWTGTRSVGNSQIYDSGTYVGIGTSSPAYKLHVVTSSGTAIYAYYNSDVYAYLGNSTYTAYFKYSKSGGSSNYAYFGYAPSGDDDRGLYIALDNNVNNATTQDWTLFARSYGDSVQGSSYSYLDTRGGLYADQYWCSRNQHYTFGVVGYWYDSDDGYANRCGGVFGAAEMAGYWASLGYRNSGNNEYGLYYTSSASGSGLLRTNPDDEFAGVREGIGMGGYADLLGGWVRGELYGMNIKGERYALYVDGPTFSNTPYAVLHYVDGPERVPTFVNTSTDVSITTSGIGRLVDGKAHIDLDKTFTKVVSREVPLVIIVTPMGGPYSLYVADWNYDGFTVKEIGDGHSSAQFSWIVIGRQKGYERKPDIPEEVLRNDYDEKMSEVMFNENNLTESARQIWWDGEKLRFDRMPPKPNDPRIEEQKRLMQMREPGVNDGLNSE